MAIIEVNHVTKEFRLGQLHSLKQSALDAMARIRGRSVPQRAPFKALDDVDFKVERGEVLGIIGHNGAGKSTLLKMLARIVNPTHGSVKVQGTVAPLIEVGAGLVPDLTGRENIYLNGVILGMTRGEIRDRLDEIVAFAELEEFIDTPIKRYSSGMQVRLGFSIATSVAADILIVDEVLSVGDLAFQRKCFDRMEDMIKRQGKTVLLVSHAIRQVERLCSRVILLDHGRVLRDGAALSVCNTFYELNDEKTKNRLSKERGSHAYANQTSSDAVAVLGVHLLDEAGRPVDRIQHNRNAIVSIVFRANGKLVKPVFGVGIHTTDFLYLASTDSQDEFRHQIYPPGIYRINCTLKSFPLLPGVYSIRIGIAFGEIASTAYYAENLFHFTVDAEHGKSRATLGESGFVPLSTEWHLAPGTADDRQQDTVPREVA
jgi:lipopolysaccharide transport system ATP-binding protein